MRIELTDIAEPKKSLAVKGGRQRNEVTIQIEGISRLVDANELRRALTMAAQTPEKE